MRAQTPPEPGRCKICGCTEDAACIESDDGAWDGPCGWADGSCTLCDNPDCLAASAAADAAWRLRQELLAAADVGHAAEWAEDLVNLVNERLNEAGTPEHPRAVNSATSLLARALVANGLLVVARCWWADIGKGPQLAYDEALKSFLDELPPGLAGESIDTRETVQ